MRLKLRISLEIRKFLETFEPSRTVSISPCNYKVQPLAAVHQVEVKNPLIVIALIRSDHYLNWNAYLAREGQENAIKQKIHIAIYMPFSIHSNTFSVISFYGIH